MFIWPTKLRCFSCVLADNKAIHLTDTSFIDRCKKKLWLPTHVLVDSVAISIKYNTPFGIAGNSIIDACLAHRIHCMYV
jgi:hypothetical protein